MAIKKTKQFEYTIINDEVRIKKCIATSQTRKIVVPSTIENKSVLSIDGKVFEWNSSNNSELIIEEGIEEIVNVKALLFLCWSKVVFPQSIKKMDIDEEEILIDNGTIYIAPKNSYAEKCLKKLKLDLDYSLIVENDDVDISNARIKEIKEFKYREAYEIGIDNAEETKIGAEYSGHDKKKNTIVVPSLFNGASLQYFFFKNIPENIKKIVIPDSVKGIIGLDEKFPQAKGLEEIVIASKNPSYWTDGLAIFSKDRKTLIRFVSQNVKEYSVPRGTETISEHAFANMKKLITISIPQTVNKIEDAVFFYCDSLKIIYGLERVEDVGKNITQGCKLKKLKKTDDSEDNINMTISKNKLIKCQELSKRVIKVPDGITSIDEEAFMLDWKDSERDILEEIILPNSLEKIGKLAFARRDRLSKINIPKSVKEIGSGAFKYCSNLETIEIPDKIKEINLYELGEFSSLFIPSTLEKIKFNDDGYYAAFANDRSNCYETNYIEVDDNNPNYKSIDGILFSKDGKKAIYMPSKLGVEELEIPEGVEEICDSFAASNENLKKVIIPKTVKSIGVKAFYRAEKLKEVVFDKEIDLKTIDDRAFFSTSLEKIDIPDGVEHVGEHAFAKTDIAVGILPKSVKTIGDAVFDGVLEVVVYDTIDPGAGDAYVNIEKMNGTPNSALGFIGIGLRTMYTRHACNQIINNYTITVKSAETDKTKYKVWMGAERNDRDYSCFLASAWGKNATFAFRELDNMFSKIKGKDHKLRVAEYRLKYPVDLSTTAKEAYTKYLKRYSSSADEILKEIEKDD